MNLIESLTAEMHGLEFLSRRRNPVLRSSLDSDALTGALTQYCHLPRMIVSLLTLGLQRLNEQQSSNQWTAVAEDIAQNIADETGRRTGGVAHFAILQNGLQRELGLKIDDFQPIADTLEFVAALEEGLKYGTVPYVSGVLWGLEATAVPELIVVAEAINMVAGTRGLQQVVDLSQKPPEKIENWEEISLSHFLRLHVAEIEIDHCDGLANAVLEHIQKNEYGDFREGFRLVTSEMSVWWRRLAKRHVLLSVGG